MSIKHYLITIPLVALFFMIGHKPAQAEPSSMGPTSTADMPPLEILDAEYGGTGCPAGSASVVIAGNTMTILFDEYVTKTSPGYRTDRKSCNYAVALKVPKGYTIALLKIDYRGFADIPEKGIGMLVAEYFWAGSFGPVFSRFFKSGFFGTWKETDYVSGAVWSPCGGKVIARGNTSTVARKSSPHSSYEAELSVDSLDMDGKIVHYFDWAHC